MWHKLGWYSDVIEVQLAYARRRIGGIYNRSHRLPERTRMMQAWGNYINALKDGAKVTAIHA